jgi:hypothetical protein
MPCSNGTREVIEARKAQVAASVIEPRPSELIEQLIRARHGASDEALLAELRCLPALADESNDCWDDGSYQWEVAYLYLALGDIAGARKLRAAVPLLLDKASFGDPGEIMRGLRHTLERIMAPDWSGLTAICVTALKSGRAGTRLWAAEQLRVLRDPSASAALKTAMQDGVPEVREAAEAAWNALTIG